MQSETIRIDKTFLPAAGHDWALPLYDPLVKLLGAEAAKMALLDQAAVLRNHRVLDIACGTGSLATLIKVLHPQAKVVGLDPDPKALAKGRQKAERAAVSIRFDQGLADELPYAAASFDRVFSSFMFHHLPADRRQETLREVRRVLAPGGCFHLLDSERPEKVHGSLAHWLHSSHHLSFNSEARILTLMQQAEFVGSKRVLSGTLLFGLLRISYYQASVPAL